MVIEAARSVQPRLTTITAAMPGLWTEYFPNSATWQHAGHSLSPAPEAANTSPNAAERSTRRTIRSQRPNSSSAERQIPWNPAGSANDPGKHTRLRDRTLLVCLLARDVCVVKGG
ncbi:MAG: hypothetical protein ACXVHK_30075, partial [Solirubrobacteraceae bacterium]